MFQRILILGALILSSACAHAQVAPAAYGGQPLVTAGGLFSYFDANYEANRMTGPGAYIDWSPPHLWHLGAEGEARWLTFNGAHNFSEYNYVVGPWYRIPVEWHRLRPYAKMLVGAGEVNFPYQLGHGGYFAIAPGGGADFALRPRWRVRADYEYQIWPNAPGIPGIQSSTLKPNGVSAGFSYQVF